jgi:hypothetical protein
MRGRAATVDAALTMTITLQSTHDQLEETFASGGRFGRHISPIASPDPERTPVRHDSVLRMRARVQFRSYQIDSFVLAEAIVDRLCAGGLAARR